MKFTLLSLGFSGFALGAIAADAPKPQPARIQAVAIDADKRTLVVRYEVAGKAAEERVTFPQAIADFRYCRWMGDFGIAVVARTGDGLDAEFCFSAFYLRGSATNHRFTKIPAPKGDYPVLGIGNTGGDSLVITAMQHSRNRSETLSGWSYIDNCPATEGGLVVGHVTEFKVPAERPVGR